MSTILNIQKIYSPNTCLLLPNDINYFISTIGKGIYKTNGNTFCVRLRRRFLKINRNFKNLQEAIEYKLEKDIEYLKYLSKINNIS